MLFDEYDAPLIDVLHEEKNFVELRKVMQSFYAPLKLSNPYLRFVFITGITKFSQLSIFSSLNNIENISLDNEYASICGISEEEIHSELDYDVELLSAKNGITKVAMYAKLKETYDGYHFSIKSPDIYNPYSLLTALKKGRIDQFWFETGTPTMLIRMMDKFRVQAGEIGNYRASSRDFDTPTESLKSMTPLLYQSGYITIKSYDAESDRYLLDIPNKEVREGLMESLLPNYVTNDCLAKNVFVDAAIDFRHDDIGTALTRLKTYFSTLPYADNINTEGHYQHMLYIMFDLMGGHPTLETRTSNGRIALTLRSKTTIYIIELKINDTAQSALDQINSKDYSSLYALEHLAIVKIGIKFDTSKRTIEEWVVER